jgi:opacity protein-like surface antigen
MKRIFVMVVFALVFITTSAQAADKGMYFSGNLGISLLSDSDVGPIPGVVSENSYEMGMKVGGAMGYDFGGFRVEGEAAYRTNNADDETGNFIPGPLTGSVSALSIMLNGYYDFHITNSSWVPYLGAGVGMANVNYDMGSTVSPVVLYLDDSDTVFAYQFIAGAGYKISSNTTLTVDYRYFATKDPSVRAGAGLTATACGGACEMEYQTHEFNLGARFRF